jgi:hypothetical protein
MLPKIVTSLTKYIIDGEKAYACTMFPIQDHTIAIAIAIEDEYSIRYNVSSWLNFCEVLKTNASSGDPNKNIDDSKAIRLSYHCLWLGQSLW